MITIGNDNVSFTFPDLSRAWYKLRDEQVRRLLPKIALPANRGILVDQLCEDIWDFPVTRGSNVRNGTTMKLLREVAEAFTTSDLERAMGRHAEKSILLPDGINTAKVTFVRTLRSRDGRKAVSLPDAFGRYGVFPVDTFTDSTPPSLPDHDGIVIPMFQSEALWLKVTSQYPFVLKVRVGDHCAISGKPWTDGLQHHPQNYALVPEQVWLDGTFSLRQFVAAPLAPDKSAGQFPFAGNESNSMELQIFPMQPEIFFTKFTVPQFPATLREIGPHLFRDYAHVSPLSALLRKKNAPSLSVTDERDPENWDAENGRPSKILVDPNALKDWDQTRSARCFVHLCNSQDWRQITGVPPFHAPLTETTYAKNEIPWFESYRESHPAMPPPRPL